MNCKKRIVWSGIVILVFAAMIGCSLTGPGGIDKSQCYLKLRIDPSVSAKSIAVSEVSVTGLEVEIYDSAGTVMESILWDPGDGPQVTLLAFDEEGEYEIVVTHYGDGVEVSESDTFELKPMIITVIHIVPGVVGAISVEPGEGTGSSTNEIDEAAITVLSAMVQASAGVSGGGELPDGITADTSGHDWSQGGGTIIFYFNDYQDPDSGATLNGEIVGTMWLDTTVTPSYLDEHITGSIALTGLAVETFEMDISFGFDMDMDIGPDFSTAVWSGSITLDGYEADLDAVMAEFIVMMGG